MSDKKTSEPKTDIGGKKPVEYWAEKFGTGGLPLKAITLAMGWHATGHEITEDDYKKALDAANARHG